MNLSLTSPQKKTQNVQFHHEWTTHNRTNYSQCQMTYQICFHSILTSTNPNFQIGMISSPVWLTLLKAHWSHHSTTRQKISVIMPRSRAPCQSPRSWLPQRRWYSETVINVLATNLCWSINFNVPHIGCYMRLLKRKRSHRQNRTPMYPFPHTLSHVMPTRFHHRKLLRGQAWCGKQSVENAVPFCLLMVTTTSESTICPLILQRPSFLLLDCFYPLRLCSNSLSLLLM